MTNYSKPIVTVDAGMAEGVYAASGNGCYTARASIHQILETGRGDYRIQVDGEHRADHTKETQVLTISFNQNVTYISSVGAELISGNDSNTLKIRLHKYQNPTDTIGFGDLIVTSNPGLAITSVSITD